MPSLEPLLSLENPTKAAEMAAYHKAERRYLGISNATLNDLTKEWRGTLDLTARLDLADMLWQSDMHEARIAAAKLLTQARIRPDDAVWARISTWVAEFDAWAIADAVSSAGERRLVADPSRLDQVEEWTTRDHMWSRRAALVMTLPWTKSRHPSADETAARERILGWAATYVRSDEWFIQKAVSWWLRSLSRRDPDRVWAFLDTHGASMKPFARKDAARLLD